MKNHFLFILLVCQLLSPSPAHAEDWQTIYESDLNSGSAFNDWIPVQGAWSLTSEGMKKSGMAADGLLMLCVPVVKDALRVECEAKADAQPDELGLYLGMKDIDQSGASFLASHPITTLLTSYE